MRVRELGFNSDQGVEVTFFSVEGVPIFIENLPVDNEGKVLLQNVLSGCKISVQ